MCSLHLISPCDASALSAGSFQVQASIQVTNKTNHGITSQVLEKYSDSATRRATLKLLDQPSKTFYCDGLEDHCLLVDKAGGCRLVSQQSYTSLVFGDAPLVPLLQQQVFGDPQTSHFVGVSRLLYFIDQSKSRMTNRPTSASNSKIGLRSRYLELGFTTSKAKLSIIYEETHLGTNLYESLVLPSRVELIEDENLLATIEFRRFSWLKNHTMHNLNYLASMKLKVDDFVIPLGFECSKALSEVVRKRKPLHSLNSTRVSFQTCLAAPPADPSVRDSSSNCSKLFVTIDSEEKLLRRDVTLSPASGHSRTLKTIYDFKTNRKYSILHTDKSSACVTSRILGAQQETPDLTLFDHDKAIYMGSTSFQTRKVSIYEQSLDTGAPFWLTPSLGPLDGQGALALKASVSLVFYLDAVSDHFSPIMMEIISRGRNYHNKILRIQEFNSERSSASNPFNLANFCHQNSLKFMQVSMLLELKRNLIQYGRLQLAKAGLQIIRKPIERVHIIERSLLENFNLRPTLIDIRSSKLLHRPLNHTFGLTFDFTLANEKLIEDQSIYLLSEVADQDINRLNEVAREPAPIVAEDCFWLAAHFSQSRYKTDRDMDATLFAYSIQSGECIILQRTDHDFVDKQLGPLNLNRCYAIFQVQHLIRTSSTEFKQHSPTTQLTKSKLLSQNFPLTLSGPNHEPIQLELTIKDAVIRAEEPSDRISGFSWRLSSKNGLVWVPKSIKRMTRRFELGANKITNSFCRALCLADLKCRSHSFCEKTLSKSAECYLSQVDLEESNILNQIYSSSPDNITLASSSSRQLEVHRGFKISVKSQKHCSIQPKRYLDQFEKKTHSQAENLLCHGEKIIVKTSEECASMCYEHNLQKVPLDPAENYCKRRIVCNPFESLLEWRKQRIHAICTYFYLFQVEGREEKYCALSVASSQPDRSKSFSRDRLVAADLFKLVFANFYDSTFAIRLGSKSNLSASVELSSGNESIFSHYKHLIKLHKKGINLQVTIVRDNVEQCSQACTLQTHGPYPTCSSFDFVQEKIGNQTRTYCLLNSWTYGDLKRISHLNGQVEYLTSNKQADILFWHYEPKPEVPTRVMLKPDDQLLSLIDEISPMEYLSLRYLAFNSISVIILLSLITGISLSVKILSCWKSKIRELPPKCYVEMRRVHRSSGVSIRSNLRSGEVLM